jgi:HAD superfamily hydrolase (TIGR01549 family)
MYEALNATLNKLFGDCDPVKLKEIRDRQIMAPYTNNFIENNPEVTSRELIRELYNRAPETNELKELMNTRFESFLQVTESSEETLDLIAGLKADYKLAVISNFPCTRSIIESLKKNGLYSFFDTIIVSGDVGFVKPHPKPFQQLFDTLGTDHTETVFIGDNWLADIQGAKRMGMKAIHTTQYVSYESFEPYKGDYKPDLCIKNLNELNTYF